ncbi:MAG: hypothetical protein D6798_02395 [Deltaproteobacteria bacterium]|nr:MAG: hypothetical protein D6798_02395 [Deltaproteobacteria bacterium]
MRASTAPVLLLAGCAWQAPLDPDAPPPQNSLSGTVVYSGAEPPGDVIVVLYDAHDPPPPEGTGGPVNFATVPAEDFIDDADGLRAASWDLAPVPDGTWLISALMDMDGDFHPLLTATAGATCGDIAGPYLQSLAGTELAPVTVRGGQLVDDLTLVLGLTYPIERPAFQFADNLVDQGAPAAITDPTDDSEILVIQSTAVESELLEITGPLDVASPKADPCDTAFYLHFLDEDGDGDADPHWLDDYAALGVRAAWPRIYAVFRGSESVPLEPGEVYAVEAIPDPFLRDGAGGSIPTGVVVPVTELRVAFPPAGQHVLPDGSVEVVGAPDLPDGEWDLTVVQETGQTWTLPNELPAFAATGADWEPATQAQVLVVQGGRSE